MKVLVLYDYPPMPGGLATQGDMLYKGIKEMGVEVYPVNSECEQEKEWYYQWFKPDVAVGIGYWGHTPHLILHPQQHGIRAVPWLVADGYLANYEDVLNALPLILVTSKWVKGVYTRDGLHGKNIEVLPVGIDTDAFTPRDQKDPNIACIRQALGIGPEEIMLLTVGGDAASKGAQEVMQALALIDAKAPPWKYVCKVWPQGRTLQQNIVDLELASSLDIKEKVIYVTNVISRNFMPYLINACDIYVAPSRLEGFGMPQIEAGASGKPVLGINAMAMTETLVHGETALLAGVATEVIMREATVGLESGWEPGHQVVFPKPRTVEYRASIHDIANQLMELMQNAELRKKMGEAGRKRAVANYDYRVVARKFVQIASAKLRVS